MLLIKEGFALFDEWELYSQTYHSFANRVGKETFVPRNEFYQILTPFLMESQFDKWLESRTEPTDEEKKKKTRKRKRNIVEAPDFLKRNSQHVQNIFDKFRTLATSSEPNTLRKCFPFDIRNMKFELIKNGNQIARGCVKAAPLYTPTETNSAKIETVRIERCQASTSATHQSATMCSNPKDHCILVDSTVLPPNSSFLLGDVQLVRDLPTHAVGQFDFIVMDPPWPNRTVKRQKTYELFDGPTFVSSPLNELTCLPISHLLANGGILCIWLSNSATAHDTARTLIERWKLRKLALWHWLKICKLGEPVCPFRPEHKVPFESVLLACKSEDEEIIAKFAQFTEEFCLINVPNANPSRKPPISLLLHQLGLIPRPVQNGLELFARYMLPNFTSVGYEATKFQHKYYLESDESDV